MARLEDRLRDHPLYAQIDAIRNHVSELDDDARAAVSEHVDDVIERVPKVLTYVEGILKTADAALTTESGLAGLDSALSNAAGAASQLKESPQVAPTLDQHLEEALVAAGPLVAASALIAERADAAAGAFDTALTDTVKEVDARSKALSEELTALDERRAQAAAEQEAAEEQRRQEFSAGLDALTTRVDGEAQRTDQLISTLQTQFDSGQTEQKQAFDTLREGFEEQAKAAIDGLQESARQTGEDLSEQAEEVLVAVRKRRTDVEELYGVITDTSTTGAFRDEAKDQKEAADRWRWVAVGFGVVAVALAIVALTGAFESETSGAGAVVAKITATLVAAGIAAYAGRQSGRHREREEEAKRLELELAAFPPFIESLDDDQKRDVRKEFADRAFRGRPVETGESGLFRRKDSFGVALPELVAAIVTAVRKSDQQPPTGGGA